MASKGSVFSQTLHDITNTKLHELEKKRAKFEEQRERIIALTQHEPDATKKLAILARDIKTCFSIPTSAGRVVRGASNDPRLEIDLIHLDRFLSQAKYDPSVSPKLLQQWQHTFLRHLDVQSTKFTYASLYGQLTTEGLAKDRGQGFSTTNEDAEMSDFERVSTGKKLESRRKWEDSVFQTTEVDRSAVTTLLHDVFESTPEDSKHLVKGLQQIREGVEKFEKELAVPDNFNSRSLIWTIKGLVASDLLDDEKRAALRDFMGNPTILNEVADVLNMRMVGLEDWSWGSEVLLEQRRRLNGSFNIYMHEDLLQAVFLQYIGVKWSVFWKRTFADFRRSPSVWKMSRTSIDPLVRKRRDFFLGAVSGGSNVQSGKQRIYDKSHFLSQLRNSETQEAFTDEGDEEADFEKMTSKPRQGRAKQTARKTLGGRGVRGNWASSTFLGRSPQSEDVGFSLMDDEKIDDEDDDNDAGDGPKNPMEAKQNLLHLLSTEVLIKTKLHGEFTCFRSQIDSLYPSLPHSTIENVLKFFGVSAKWLQFFGHFLKAPLRFVDDEGSEPRLRQTGTPASHVLSDVFGETILFCLDFYINQECGGELLWRMHDDFWFWSSDHATCVKAWSTIERFVKIMGLTLNNARTGAVRMSRKSSGVDQTVPLNLGDVLPEGQIRWGMLYLNPESGRFEIDQKMVDEHIDELSRQLKDKTKNIFAWIQAWNSYAATFFTSNFGKPANCFGRQHVDNMLATHERIQRRVFSSSAGIANSETTTSGDSVTEFLRRTIAQRYKVQDIPDGYFYFPTELGGLEVRNPFIGLLQIRDAVQESPSELLNKFEEAEKEAYKAARIRFQDWRDGKIQTMHSGIQDPDFRPQDQHTFFSFEEYINHREELHYGFPNELVKVFGLLLEKPKEEGIESISRGSVLAALAALGKRTGLRGILSNWHSMEPYWKWVAQLYGPEMIEIFDGFGIVDPSLLPMGMVSEFRSGRVDWQE
ncbi:MAG: hypothetical protein Q9195_009322 [Heterodermia aff. obscurata]